MNASLIALALALSAPVLERQHAPTDGWAAMEGGTRGGAMALPADVHTVHDRAGLLRALSTPGPARIVRIAALIDMSEGRAFADTGDQAKRGSVRIPSNTTLLGVVDGAGFVNGTLQVAGVQQVIIRNLSFRNPCDVAPRWDPNDGAKGNWNSSFDAIAVSNSKHVWIDHNRFTDAPVTDDTLPIENGMLKQCHDGALDISQGSDFVSVTHNHFALHEKNTLVGSSDRSTGDKGHLRVTFKANLFEDVAERAPRVRYGQVHVYNNYYVGDRKHAAYQHNYSIGVATGSSIASHANNFDIRGARHCGHVIKNPGQVAGVFADAGSTLNGAALADCPYAGELGWRIPYQFSPVTAGEVPAYVRANAGPQPVSATGGYVEARLAPHGGAPFRLNAFAASVQVSSIDGGTELQLELFEGERRLKQVRRRSPPSGGAVRLALEHINDRLSVYLDGERVTTAVVDARQRNAPVSWAAAGHQLLDIRSAPGSPPGPLQLFSRRLRLQAGDPPAILPLPARYLATPDRNIVQVQQSANAISIVPVAPGQTRIHLSDPADHWSSVDLTADVGPAHIAPPRQALPARLQPAPASRGVPPDTPLRITTPLKAPLQGSLRVYRVKDKALVAIVRAEDIPSGLRAARQPAISTDGNSLDVRIPKLDYGTEYEVVAETAFIAGGIKGWTFRTTPFRPVGDSITVDDDGRADFRTVQGALDHAMAMPRSKPVTIHVREGVYPELLHLRGKDNLTLRGASPEASIIRASNTDARNPGSNGRALFLAEDSDMLEIRDITLHNTARRSDGQSAQAEALYFNHDQGRLMARNAHFISEQDTLQLTGYAWFYQTLVAGNVDFIWGHNRAALFEESEIRTVGDSARADSGGYIVQARTVDQSDPGFIFLRSRFTSGPGPAGNLPPPRSTYLARSPGTPSTWDKVAYIDCEFGSHIASDGWLRVPAPHPADGWREHGNNSSHGGSPMPAAEVARLSSRANVFARRGWNPQP
jgi:pectate lyase/pectin methylesterase-like acyl-CoA thioesterase